MTENYINLKKYEISLWEDTIALRDGVEFFKENKLFVIGSDVMNTQNSVFAPKLTKNVNGSKTLEFSIHSRYYNERDGKIIDNPFINYLTNERKIKLYYKNEWYDFLIKNVNEGSEENTFIYSCEDLYINELSKIGYNLQFNTELENNQGSITQLTEKIIADTDWTINYDNTETIQQTKDEPLYDLLISNITKNGQQITTFPAFKTTDLTSTNITVSYEGSVIKNHFYVIYSSSTEAIPEDTPSLKFFQFICKDGSDTFVTDDDRIITDADDLFLRNVKVEKNSETKVLTKLSWTTDNNDKYIITFNTNSPGLIYNLKGRRLVRNQLSTFDTVANRMVNIYDKSENDTTSYKSCADTYSEVSITIDAFNINKTRYWIKEGNNYIQCTESSIFDNTKTYYIKIIIEYNKEWDYYILQSGQYIKQQKTNPTESNYINKTIYDSNRNIYLYKIIYYGYTESDYVSPIILGDLLGNDDCLLALDNAQGRKIGITSISGWQPVSGDTVEQNMYPQYDYGSGNLINWSPTTGSIIFHPHESNSPILNSKVTGNSIFSTYQKSHKLTLRLNLYKADSYTVETANRDDYITSENPVPTQKWYKYGDKIDLSSSNIFSAYIGYYRINEYGAIIEEDKEKLYTFNNFRSGNDGLYYADAECTTSLSEEWVKEMMSGLTDSLQIGFFIKIAGNDYYLSDAMQLYEYQTMDGNQIYPGQTPEAKSITWYCYYPYDATIKEEKDIVLEYRKTEDSNSYIPRYSTFYEKVRSIEGSESNCFNLIQTLCETFECWARFTVWHNPETGEVDRDINNEYIHPNKQISFHKYVGKDNDVGFIYGINLQSIERTLATDEIVTKLIVKENTNDYATDGYCTIARSEANPTKQNFIFNFDYYTNKNLLNGTQVYNDLYKEYGDYYLGYYPKMKKISNEELSLINQLANINIDMISLEANLESSYTIYNSAFETYSSFQNDLMVQHGISYEQLKDTSTIEGEKKTEIQTLLKTDTSFRQRLSEVETAYQKYLIYKGRYENYHTSRVSLKEKLFSTEDSLKTISSQKSALNKELFEKYSRYIQEGTWNDDSYMDDTLYYYDAEALLYDSAYPKVEYNINVIDIREIDGYECYDFDVGDKTFIQDTEFFGYISRNDNEPYTPRKQEVIVSEITWNLDNPIDNSITVQNYKSQFEDLFQRITATVQSVDYSTGQYDRAAATVVNGTFDLGVFQETLDENSISIINPKNKAVIFDEHGITLRDLNDPTNFVRLTSGGIYTSADSGNTWGAAITGNGINTNMLTSGNINTDNITIGGIKNYTFSWDKKGLSAYDFNEFSKQEDLTEAQFNANKTLYYIKRKEHNYERCTIESIFSSTETYYIKTDDICEVNYNKFVRFDKYGLYGIKNINTSKWTPSSINEIKKKGYFGITWDGFFIRSSHLSGGRVEITDEEDIKVYDKFDTPRVEIGLIGEDTSLNNVYGIVLRKEAVPGEDNRIFYTDNEGNLTITGIIHATGGKIAGFNIIGETLQATNDNNTVLLSPSEIILGKTGSPSFRVAADGSLTATNGNFSGKITTSVLEAATTRMVGGAMIYKTAEIIDKITEAIVELKSKDYSHFSVGDRVCIVESDKTYGSSEAEDLTVYSIIAKTATSITLNAAPSYSSNKDCLLVYIGSAQDASNNKWDWLIATNSTKNRRNFNSLPNAITFNEVKVENDKLKLNPNVIIGDLSELGLNLSNGLYAENAYLTGSFYANQNSTDASMKLDKTGFNLGNTLTYNTTTKELDINAHSIKIGGVPIGSGSTVEDYNAYYILTSGEPTKNNTTLDSNNKPVSDGSYRGYKGSIWNTEMPKASDIMNAYAGDTTSEPPELPCQLYIVNVNKLADGSYYLMTPKLVGSKIEISGVSTFKGLAADHGETTILGGYIKGTNLELGGSNSGSGSIIIKDWKDRTKIQLSAGSESSIGYSFNLGNALTYRTIDSETDNDILDISANTINIGKKTLNQYINDSTQKQFVYVRYASTDNPQSLEDIYLVPNPDWKAWFIAILQSNSSVEPNNVDSYNGLWTRLKNYNDTVIYITSSKGTNFIKENIDTILTAHVLKYIGQENTTELTINQIGTLGQLNWYLNNIKIKENTNTLTVVDETTGNNTLNYIVKLEDN